MLGKYGFHRPEPDHAAGLDRLTEAAEEDLAGTEEYDAREEGLAAEPDAEA